MKINDWPDTNSKKREIASRSGIRIADDSTFVVKAMRRGHGDLWTRSLVLQTKYRKHNDVCIHNFQFSMPRFQE